MRNAHGIVFVVDVSAENSLQELDSIHSAVEEELSREMQMILCANKMDLVKATLDLPGYKSWAGQHRMALVRTSAKTGDGITELFAQLATQISAKAEKVRKGQFIPLGGGGAARSADENRF
jgi:Ras-related protein Rab-5C